MRRVIEAVVLVALGLGPVLFNPWSQEGFDQPKALLVIGCALALVGTLAIRGRAWYLPLSGFGALVLFSYLLATVFSPWPIIAWKGNYVRAEIGGTVLVLAYAAVGFAVAGLGAACQWVERLAAAIAVSGVVAALYAIVQALGLDPLTWTPSVGVELAQRPGSTFGNPNYLGGYLVMAVPFAALLLWRGHGPLWGVAVLVMGVGILCSESRGAALGLCAVGVLAAYKDVRILRGGSAVVAAVGLLLAAVFLSHGMRWASVEQRLTVWRDVAALSVQRPVLGYGPDTLGGVYKRQDVAVDGTRWEKTENRLLDALFERGVVGLLADLALLIAAAVLALRRGTLLASTALVSIAGGFVVGLVDVMSIPAWLLQWASLGLIAAEAE